jgi:hypothetical protein
VARFNDRGLGGIRPNGVHVGAACRPSLFHDYVLRDKEGAFRWAIRLHVVALAMSGVSIMAGVLGAHGAMP